MSYARTTIIGRGIGAQALGGHGVVNKPMGGIWDSITGAVKSVASGALNVFEGEQQAKGALALTQQQLAAQQAAAAAAPPPSTILGIPTTTLLIGGAAALGLVLFLRSRKSAT